MRTKAGILSLSAVGLALLLSSCQYTNDPNKEWKDRALEAYKTFYAKEENQDLEKDPLFYFDISTFKGVLVRSETDVEYLGQLNFSNFSFSENPNKYFVDFGNVPMTFNDTNDDGNPDSFTFGNYIRQDESGNTVFDVKELMNNLPFVLHEDNFGKEKVKTYSMVKDGGVIEDTSNAKAYDPNFFYISDFSLQIDGAEDLTGDILNFKGKDLAFLRNDLYSIIDSLLNQEDIQNINEFLGLSQTLKNTYRRSVGIPLDQNMPNEITIDGTHYSDFDTEREVVVGPISFVPTLLSHYLPEIGAAEFEPSIYDVETIRIGEGVKTISFYAFYGERDAETGASKSNLKNVYLPSTLQDIQFNAFSNLDLENIYIPKTYTEVNGVKTESNFETVDFGDASITLDEGSENPLELDITTSFGNTSIQNIYFEDYSNLNIQTFPYSTINFADSDARNEAIKIYHGEGDTTKFDKLSDALNTYETVNPFYQMVLNTDQEKSKFVITSDVSNIAKGKKLYLPYFEYSLSTSEARSVVTTSNSTNLSDEVNSTDAAITLKLDQDLTIEGSLIVGAQVGRSKIGSGDIVGQFSAIDLNGHKLTVKNGGSLEGNGLIFDSTNNGEVIVESGGQLTTNLTITNYKDFASIQNRAENGANLFDSYKFNSLKVKTTFKSGSSLLANIDYASQTYVNENKFEYIGSSSNSLFSLESGSLVLTSSGLTGSGSKVSINDVSLLTIEDLGSSLEDSNEIFKASTNGFNLSNKDFSVDLNEVNLNTHLRCESGSLYISNLTLNNGGKIYSSTADNLIVCSSINVNESTNDAWILGDVKANDITSFENITALVSGENKSKLSYSNTVSEVTSLENETLETSVKNLRVILGENRDVFEKLLFKNQVSSYYLYENNFTSGSLYGNDSTEVLASYTNKGEWVANNVEIGEEDIRDDYATNIASTNQTINSFTSSDQTSDFVLNAETNRWEKISHANELGIYSDKSGAKYIKTSVDSSLIPGDVLINSPSEKQVIFVGSEDNALYIRSDLDESDNDNWVKVTSYDNNYVLKEVDSSNYFALLSGDIYTSGVSYDSSSHIISENGTNYAYTGKSFAKLNDDEKLLNGTKNTIKGEDDTGYVFINALGAWERTGTIGYNLADGSNENQEGEPTKYYFNVNGSWLSSVDESSYALTYNDLADYSFGVLENRYSYDGQRYKFVMREGDTDTNNENPFELFTPQGMVKVEQKDFEDIWPDNITEDSFHAYRHITKVNGDKYLFFMNENGEIELRRFEFAVGFTPSVPDPDNNNPLTKYNFIIYKVNFYNNDGTLDNKTVTLYVNVDSSNSDNAIYAGNAEETDSDDYLAIAVFTLTNPISTLTNSLE